MPKGQLCHQNSSCKSSTPTDKATYNNRSPLGAAPIELRGGSKLLHMSGAIQVERSQRDVDTKAIGNLRQRKMGELNQNNHLTSHQTVL